MKATMSTKFAVACTEYPHPRKPFVEGKSSLFFETCQEIDTKGFGHLDLHPPQYYFQEGVLGEVDVWS
jgi:hypothetical protein